MVDMSYVFISVFLALAFFFTSLVLLLRTFLFHYGAENVETARQPRHELLFAGTSLGLTPSAIAGIPTYAFQREIKPGGGSNTGSAQCAICLSFLEEAEMVRQLPDCKHAFHVECIDKWLNSHATCPLCRSTVTDANDSSQKDLEAQTSAS